MYIFFLLSFELRFTMRKCINQKIFKMQKKYHYCAAFQCGISGQGRIGRSFHKLHKEVQQDFHRLLGSDGPVLCAGSPAENNMGKRICLTLFCQIYLRHCVQDVLATKTEECCVCVPVRLDFIF